MTQFSNLPQVKSVSKLIFAEIGSPVLFLDGSEWGVASGSTMTEGRLIGEYALVLCTCCAFLATLLEVPGIALN